LPLTQQVTQPATRPAALGSCSFRPPLLCEYCTAHFVTAQSICHLLYRYIHLPLTPQLEISAANSTADSAHRSLNPQLLQCQNQWLAPRMVHTPLVALQSLRPSVKCSSAPFLCSLIRFARHLSVHLPITQPIVTYPPPAHPALCLPLASLLTHFHSQIYPFSAYFAIHFTPCSVTLVVKDSRTHITDCSLGPCSISPMFDQTLLGLQQNTAYQP
jgi:hypothetical protein